ncbi:cation transporter [Halobacillus shinanisalinarum]|uniref:Cation transporter n=1 Tax=Halobacillus shinanisalinarum TaxID=2932258 RepID=A0ABY4H2S5_9BACI|nr:cation transporter [Halobacillus shinanisalinarum]UOQ94659.1 cation transporter [Halobacillus shinanisalinarum]
MEKRNDSRILRLSIAGSLVFTAIGVIWGIAANSQMIIFDGLYSFISLALSALSLIGFSFIQKKEPQRFHYGKEIVEPLIITFKASVIAALCLYALSSSLIDIFRGGRDVELGSATIYALVATILCYVVYKFMSKNRNGSEFVKAESVQWLMDTLLSAAVLIGFIIAVLLSHTKLDYLTPYIDPGMVFIVSLYFLKTPAKMFSQNIKEILMMPPPRKHLISFNKRLTKSRNFTLSRKTSQE